MSSPTKTPMNQTPSELCREAAERLMRLAREASPGRWELYYDGGLVGMKTTAHRAVAIDFTQRDAEWITTFDPTIAPVLIDWLNEEADVLRWASTWDEVAETPVRHLVTRLIPTWTDPGPGGRYLDESTE